jgi:hypothetical protein
MQVGDHVIGLEEFKSKFCKAHIPSVLIKVIKDKFINLKQGGMSVLDYMEKFTTLSRYAPEDTNTVEKKKDHFMNGLNEEIQSILVAVPYPYLESIVDPAIMVESKRKVAFESPKAQVYSYQERTNQPRSCSLPSK